MQPFPPLRLGIVGAGRAAQLLHAPALLQLPEQFRVSMVWDPEEARARALCSRFPGARIASDADALFAGDVQAVAILTPPATHVDLALRALRARKHVLVEKPLAASAAEAARLTREAHASGVCAAAGHNLRFHRLVRRAADAIKHGALGRLLEIETRWISPADVDANWRSDRAQGGGVLFDLGVHHIDLAHFLGASEFSRLSAVTDSLGSDDLRAHADGVLENGVRFNAVWSKGAQALHTVRLTGTAATIEFSMYNAASWRLSPAARSQRARDFLTDLYHAVAGRKSGGDSAASYRLQWLDFAEAVRTGRPPACSFEEASRNVAACESLAAAAKTAAAEPTRSGPALSVVLGVRGTFSAVRHTVRCLRAQTARDRIELVLVWASGDEANVPALEVEGFFACLVERVAPDSSVARSNAEGARRASADVVAFAEDHCFPEPEWAEALIDAHARGYAAVGPEIVNGNPGTIISWCDYLIGYGPWMSPVAAGEVPFLPGHNSSYKRRILLQFGERLEALLESETVLHYELAGKGRRLYVEPRARAVHLNFARWNIGLPVQFHCGRVFAGSRAARWSAGRKAFYTAASPLIPVVRLLRISRELLLPNRPRHLLPRLLPGLALALVCDGAGQMLGYLAGQGRSPASIAAFEFNRVRYIRPADRRALEEADARAAT